MKKSELCLSERKELCKTDIEFLNQNKSKVLKENETIEQVINEVLDSFGFKSEAELN